MDLDKFDKYGVLITAIAPRYCIFLIHTNVGENKQFVMNVYDESSANLHVPVFQFDKEFIKSISGKYMVVDFKEYINAQMNKYFNSHKIINFYYQRTDFDNTVFVVDIKVDKSSIAKKGISIMFNLCDDLNVCYCDTVKYFNGDFSQMVSYDVIEQIIIKKCDRVKKLNCRLQKILQALVDDYLE